MWQMWSHSWHLKTVDTSQGPQWKSLEVFSCNCLKHPGLCSPPITLPGLLLMRTLSSQATKGVAVYGSGMLNMGSRGACDPNKFQILFPATSGSSCVQALRPFPTSPSFPFPEGLFPFTAWSPRATPAAGCERKECVSLCMRDTPGLFGGRGFCITPFHWFCCTSPLPPTPWVLMVPKVDLFMASSWCPVWP